VSAVILTPANWFAAPGAELLREPLKDALLCRKPLNSLRRQFDRILLMAGSKSDFLEQKVVNQILGATAYTAPSNVSFGLWTTAAATSQEASVGNTAGEVASSGAYDRVTLANNTTNFANTGANVAHINSVAATFPTASANWNSAANIPQVLLFDTNLKTAADNLLLWADLTTAKPVLNGDQAQFAAGAFSWSED
jgi:hypothetical protein